MISRGVKRAIVSGHGASAGPLTAEDLSPTSLQRSDEPSLNFSYKAIEQLQVGDRVVSDNPDTDTPEQTAVDPSSWRLVKLYAEEKWPDGTLDTIHVQTLQPPAWLERFDVKVGAQVPPPLDLVEMALPANLLTTVKSIGPCPTLQPGPGRLVLTTVNHLNNDVWELTAVNAAGRREQLRPTGFHKFYSETRGDWVSTKEIHDNEVIRGRAGPLTIVASQPLRGTSRVYNLTVEGEHVYYVSELGLLAHNNCGNQNTSLVVHPFSGGGTHITTTARLERFRDLGSRTYGSPDFGLFIAPRNQVDDLLSRASSRHEVEIALGLAEGALSGGKLVRIDVDDPFSRVLRLPTEGNEFFRPGTGLTTGNLNEGIINAPKIGTRGVRKSVVSGF